MRAPKTEKYCHRTAIPTFVLEEIGSVFGTHLGTCYVGTGAANQLPRVIVSRHFNITSSFPSVISLQEYLINFHSHRFFCLQTNLVTLIAYVVSITIHSVCSRIIMKTSTRICNCFNTVQAFVLQPHESLPANIFPEFPKQKRLNCVLE